MEEKTYLALLQAVDKFYSDEQSGQAEIQQIIKSKIEELDHVTQWTLFVREFKTKFTVVDLSYVQFPSRQLHFQKIVNVGNYCMHQNFTIIFSLLCPYYTYFFEYDIRIRTLDGDLFGLNKIAFLNEKKFNLVKDDIDLDNIRKQVEIYFPGYSYVNHYRLMTEPISGKTPFGILIESPNYYMFQFLFDKDIANNIFR